MLLGPACVSQEVGERSRTFWKGLFPDPSDRVVTLIEARGSFRSSRKPDQDHTLAAGVSGGLKGYDRRENVETRRREKRWPKEQLGQSMINRRRTSMH